MSQESQVNLELQDNERYDKAWTEGETSFWSTFIKTLKLDQDPVDLIKSMETLIVPRYFYKGMYKIALELSLQHFDIRVGNFLKKSRRLTSDNVDDALKARWSIVESYINSGFSRDKCIINFHEGVKNISDDSKFVWINLESKFVNYFNKSKEITPRLVELLKEEETVSNYYEYIKDDNLQEFENLLRNDANYQHIGCYIAGDSGKPEFIKIAREFDSVATFNAMARKGDRNILQQSAIVVDDAINMKKILLINNHNEIFKEMFGVGYKDTIYKYGSPKLMKEVVEKDDNFHLKYQYVEAYVIYMQRFGDDYDKMEKDLPQIRKTLPSNIIEVMMKMNEVSRHNVFDFTMDERVIRGDMDSREIIIASIIKSFHTKPSYTVSAGLLRTVKLTKSEIKQLLPSDFESDRVILQGSLRVIRSRPQPIKTPLPQTLPSPDRSAQPRTLLTPSKSRSISLQYSPEKTHSPSNKTQSPSPDRLVQPSTPLTSNVQPVRFPPDSNSPPRGSSEEPKEESIDEPEKKKSDKNIALWLFLILFIITVIAIIGYIIKTEVFGKKGKKGVRPSFL